MIVILNEAAPAARLLLNLISVILSEAAPAGPRACCWRRGLRTRIRVEGPRVPLKHQYRFKAFQFGFSSGPSPAAAIFDLQSSIVLR
jgi:hypothetical protein